MEKAREILNVLHEQLNVTKPVLEVKTFTTYTKLFQFLFFVAVNLTNVTFILQAVIHLESIFPCEKRIEFLDSLVEKFVTPESSQGEVASLVDKEEISSIFLEVKYGLILRT